MLQLSPPDAWLRQLSQRISAHLCSSTATYQPLELLYISRAADDTLTQYCMQVPETASVPGLTGIQVLERDVTASSDKPLADGGGISNGSSSGNSSSRSSGRNGRNQSSGGSSGSGSSQRPPPVWLAEIVRDSYMLLRKATPLLPPHWQSLNFRYPPYAQPQNVSAREEGS